MNISHHVAAGRGLATTHIDNIPTILRTGLRPAAALKTDPDWTELQAADYVRTVIDRPLMMPGRPRAGDFTTFGFTPHTPAVLQIITGHNGVTKRGNAEIIHIQTSTDRLNQAGILHFFIDRHLLSPRATIALDHRLLQVDDKLLASRDFRSGRTAEFGAGILAFGPLPPEAIEALVCAEEEVRDRVAAAVADGGLTIPVVLDPSAFFWPTRQHRPIS